MIRCIIADCEYDRDVENNLSVCRRDRERMAFRLRALPRLVADLASLGYVARDDLTPRVVYPAGHDREGQPVPHLDPVARALTAGPLSGASNAPRVNGSGEASVPIRVDPTDLLSPARAGSLAVAARSPWPDDQIGHLSAATELDFWVMDWSILRGESLPAPDVHTLSRWLLDRLDWACREHAAVDEFAEKLRQLHGALSAAAGERPAPPEPRDRECPRCRLLTLVLDRSTGYTECTAEDCRALLTEEDYREYLRDLIADPSWKVKP